MYIPHRGRSSAETGIIAENHTPKQPKDVMSSFQLKTNIIERMAGICSISYP